MRHRDSSPNDLNLWIPFFTDYILLIVFETWGIAILFIEIFFIAGFYSLKFLGKLFTNVSLMLRSQGYSIRTNIVTYTQVVWSLVDMSLLLSVSFCWGQCRGWNSGSCASGCKRFVTKLCLQPLCWAYVFPLFMIQADCGHHGFLFCLIFPSLCPSYCLSTSTACLGKKWIPITKENYSVCSS